MLTKSILLFKCLINLKHKLDGTLSCITEYIDIVKKTYWTPYINVNTYMHIPFEFKNWNGWRVCNCNRFTYSFFVTTMERKLPGQQDDNDGYFKSVVLNWNMGLGFLWHGHDRMSLALTFPCHISHTAWSKVLIKLV